MTMQYAINKMEALNNKHANNFLHKMRAKLTQECFEKYCENCGLIHNEESLAAYLNMLLSIYEYGLK